jgi:hypothetical protein
VRDIRTKKHTPKCITNSERYSARLVSLREHYVEMHVSGPLQIKT